MGGVKGAAHGHAAFGGAIHTPLGELEGGLREGEGEMRGGSPGVPPATSPTKVGAEHTRTPLLRSLRGIEMSLAAIVRCEQAPRGRGENGRQPLEAYLAPPACRSQLAPCPIPHPTSTPPVPLTLPVRPAAPAPRRGPLPFSTRWLSSRPPASALTFLRRPEVPGFCPSNGLVWTV